MRVNLSGPLAGCWVEAEPFTVADGYALFDARLPEQRAALASHITAGNLPCPLTAEGLRSLSPRKFAALLNGVVMGEEVDYRALHDAMDGEAPPPVEWYASRLCEEGLATSMADALAQPYAATTRALTMRAYARARQVVERAEKQADIPDTPMVQEVQAVLIEKAAEVRRLRAV